MNVCRVVPTLDGSWEVEMRVRISRVSRPGKPTDKAYRSTYMNLWTGERVHDWFIKVRSLEDLLDLIKKEGNIIIYAPNRFRKELSIDIYDDYVE